MQTLRLWTSALLSSKLGSEEEADGGEDSHGLEEDVLEGHVLEGDGAAYVGRAG